jgi:hypothetical protein
MIYHCAKCSYGPCHALQNMHGSPHSIPNHEGRCALQKVPRWEMCTCKAGQECRGRVGGFPDDDSPSPVFDAEWARIAGGT